MQPIGSALHHADFHFRSLEKFSWRGGFAYGAESNAYANEGESVKSAQKSNILR